MVGVSVIIPFCNDDELIYRVVDNLCASVDTSRFEIIIVNDGSNYGSGAFRPIEAHTFYQPNVRVINNPVSFGVGYSFDRGIENANGNIVILTASDVFPRKGVWLDRVINAVQGNPNTLGCAVSVGLSPVQMDMGIDKLIRRYGAELLFTVNENDLPEYSDLRKRRGGYTTLFQGKWMMGKLSEEPYEISCLMGAFYFTSRQYFAKLAGWDTVPNNRYCGHRFWGSLEPYISLKSWLVGGGCMLHPDIEAGHVFGRIDKKQKFDKGLRSAEWVWWNKLFMLETMIFDNDLRRRLLGFVHPELNLGVAQKMIRQNHDTVLRVREHNRAKFINTPNIFTEKFNYKFKV